MDKYTDHLAQEVIGDRKIITYRQLSRTLKVHVNVAKEMLYDFYTVQNSNEPDAVHANYMLTGYRQEEDKKKVEGAEGEDTHMEASPFEATQQPDKALVRSIVVVPQEKLTEAKAKFSRLSSIHIYSLQSTKLTDLHMVSAAAQEVLESVQGEEAKEMGRVYGTISNPEAKLRSQRTVMLQTASQAPKKPAASSITTPGPKKKTAAKTSPTEKKKPAAKKSNPLASAFAKKPEAKEQPATKEKATPEKAESVPGKATESAASKKTANAFFSNWNAASQKAKEKKGNSQVSQATSQSPPAEPKDEKMESDSEAEEPAPPARDMDEDIRKRKAKRDAIEAMMDMSDEEKSPPTKKKARSPSPPAKTESPEPPPASGQSGRRRGKRKITKKVTSKDDEGYLVVKMESVWESYSEDEAPASPKPKPKATPAAAAKKGKKLPPQQGTLNSFFQKK